LREKGGDRAGEHSSLRIISSDKSPWKPGDPLARGRQGFQQLLDTDKLERLAKGPVADQIKLADQYRLHREGDVARRLEAHLPSFHEPGERHAVELGGIHSWHGPAGYHDRDHAYRGRVSEDYLRDSFRFRHYGSLYHSSLCWYPRWGHWVDWSWRYRCHVIWDPRPVYCRPIIYVAASPWSYWDCPVWAPLPVVTCGTWVDVAPVVVAEQHDLQMLAVRFVDPGHPEQELGPRYRVWFRNNSAGPITRPFNVVLIASADGRLAAGLPQAGVRVTSVEAGETQAVDVRLPFAVYAMGRDAAGEPIPFSTLHVLVDADRELAETSLANNGAAVPADQILAVDPAAFEVEPARAPAGNELLVAGEGFGPEPGRVLLHLGDVEMEAEILGWYDLGVRLALPNLPLAGATPAELIIVRSDGAAANPLSITIGPPST
jgi:hypothetical protein